MGDMDAALAKAARAQMNCTLGFFAREIQLKESGREHITEHDAAFHTAAMERAWEKREEAFRAYLKFYNPAAGVDVKAQAERSVAQHAYKMMGERLARMLHEQQQAAEFSASENN